MLPQRDSNPPSFSVFSVVPGIRFLRHLYRLWLLRASATVKCRESSFPAVTALTALCRTFPFHVGMGSMSMND